MSGSLWTPDGTVNLERDVVALSRDEIITLSKLEKFHSDHRVILVCQKCQQPLIGHNGTTDRVLSVACGCREFRHVVK